MKKALGLVEIEGLSTAVVVADAMVKAANVQVLEIENTKGLGYMTIKVTGDVGAVNASVNVGRQLGMINQKLISAKVIARPSNYVAEAFCCLPKQSSTKQEAIVEEQTEKSSSLDEALPIPVKQKAETTETVPDPVKNKSNRNKKESDPTKDNHQE